MVQGKNSESNFMFLYKTTSAKEICQSYLNNIYNEHVDQSHLHVHTVSNDAALAIQSQHLQIYNNPTNKYSVILDGRIDNYQLVKDYLIKYLGIIVNQLNEIETIAFYISIKIRQYEMKYKDNNKIDLIKKCINETISKLKGSYRYYIHYNDLDIVGTSDYLKMPLTSCKLRSGGVSIVSNPYLIDDLYYIDKDSHIYNMYIIKKNRKIQLSEIDCINSHNLITKINHNLCLYNFFENTDRNNRIIYNNQNNISRILARIYFKNHKKELIDKKYDYITSHNILCIQGAKELARLLRIKFCLLEKPYDQYNKNILIVDCEFNKELYKETQVDYITIDLLVLLPYKMQCCHCINTQNKSNNKEKLVEIENNGHLYFQKMNDINKLALNNNKRTVGEKRYFIINTCQKCMVEN